MSTLLKKYPKTNVLILLVFLSGICMLAGSVRIQLAGNMKGLFLVWNLFLAWIPFLIAFLLSAFKRKIPLPVLIPSVLLWLLFLPNAPYIITDLIHLRPRDGIPLWYDATVIFLFALHGFMLGILSALFIHEILEKYLSSAFVWLFIACCFVLSGYGIFLGRFLRWNSWDILTNPSGLFLEAMQKFTSPTAVMVTFLFALLLSFSYLIFYQLIHLKKQS